MPLGFAIFWLVLAAGLLFVLVGLWQLRRARRAGLGNGLPLELGAGAVRLRYPHWWTLSLENKETARLKTQDHDGELVIRCVPRSGAAEDPAVLLSRHLEQQRIRFDEWPPVRISEGPVPGAMLASTATLIEQDEEVRANLITYLFEGLATRLTLEYRCSVLYGLVDAYYLDLMVRTLQIDERTSGARDRTPA
ncbi:MAG TPA: hypothetical protein VGB99_02645 [Acidobacteriota bacterium]|jgi:hypothetical protein